MSQDRRTFLARLTGALAGLAAGKHIAAVDAAPVVPEPEIMLPPAPIPPRTVPVFSGAPQYSEPGTRAMSICGGGKLGVVHVNGILVPDWHQVDITNGVSRRVGDEIHISGAGTVMAFAPAYGLYAIRKTAAPEGLQEHYYDGDVSVIIRASLLSNGALGHKGMLR